MELKKLKAGMSFDDCLAVFADGNIGLMMAIATTCECAAKILKNIYAAYGIFSILDVMEIYGNDLAYLFADLCKSDEEKFLAVIWAFEIGAMQNQLGKEVPVFARVETIKKIIENLRVGKEVSFPFEEIMAFVESNSHIHFSK